MLARAEALAAQHLALERVQVARDLREVELAEQRALGRGAGQGGKGEGGVRARARVESAAQRRVWGSRQAGGGVPGAPPGQLLRTCSSALRQCTPHSAPTCAPGVVLVVVAVAVAVASGGGGGGRLGLRGAPVSAAPMRLPPPMRSRMRARAWGSW